MSMMAQHTEAIPCRVPFWLKPVSTFGLFNDDDVCRGSLMLVVTARS